MNARKHRKERRGVVLLILLGLMAMFGMVVFAFVVITGHSKRQAISFQRAEEHTVVPLDLCRHAFLEVARGSTRRASCLREHSLLEDEYGHRTATGGDLVHNVRTVDCTDPDPLVTDTFVFPICYDPTTVDPAVGPLEGQLIAFTPAVRKKNTMGTPDPSDDQDEYAILPNAYSFVGRVLTMRNGDFAKRSTRIVGYDASNNLLYMLPFEGVRTAEFINDVRGINPFSDRRHYWISGSPFSGTGFGYNGSIAATDHSEFFPFPGGLDARLPILQRDTGNPGNRALNDPLVVSPGGSLASLWDTVFLPYALLPNRAGDPSNSVTGYLLGGGQANEDYDAADYQNVLLSAAQDLNSDGVPDIPSLHRPALINYWYHRVVKEWLAAPGGPVGLPEVDAWRVLLQPDRAIAAGKLPNDQAGYAVRDAILAFKRRIFFRPLQDLHGNFSGSNSRWWQWKAQNIFDESPLEYPTLTEVRDEYWLGLNVRPPTPTRNYLGGVALNGPWDVDGDGDGVTDSVWVDLGLSPRTDKEGRRYKPLVSILCVDLDGRLNLNAHGSLAQAYAAYESNTDTTAYGSPLFANGALGSTTAALGRGQGYGPPEVSLAPVLDDDLAQYRALLTGFDVEPASNRMRWVDGRYGEAGGNFVLDADGDQLPDDPRYVGPGESFRPLQTFLWNEPDPLGPLDPRYDFAMVRSDDPLSRNKHFLLTPLASYSFFPFTAFGTPLDLKGTMAVGLDVRGQPMYWPLPDPAVSFLVSGAPMPDRFAWPGVNDPYELNLSPKGARAPSVHAWNPGVRPASRIDHPFTVYELERLLRRYDLDAGELAERLEILAQNLVGHRDEVTTESWELPCPSLGYLGRTAPLPTPPQTRPAPIRFAHFANLLRSRFRAPLRDRPDLWPAMVPREMLAGLKMNLNRPVGNGVDDNGNGVVDEPGMLVRAAAGGPWGLSPLAPSEVASVANLTDTTLWEKLPLVDAFGIPLSTGTGTPPAYRITMDHCNGVDVDSDGNDPDGDSVPNWDRIAVDRAMARQLFARYLYVLAVLVAEDSNGATLNTAVPGSWDARSLAQWAVNVVDFMDRDSIMTRFDYDPDPLDGWNPDGTTFVWGCERPELLFTETLAFHDARTRDLSTDPSGKTTTDTTDPDTDFDSFRPPEGSLFLELYNPWTSAEHLSGEFCYDRSTNSLSPGVRLNQTTPQGDPVFRLLIALPEGNPAVTGFLPRDPDVPSLAPTQVDRSVYFVQPAGTYGDGASTRFYPSNQVMAPVMPGRYAVIGPGENTGSGTTFIGYESTDSDWNGSPTPRRIILTQDANPNTQQVEVYANDLNNPDVQSVPVPAKPAVAVVMDAVTNPQDGTNRRSPRLSVSEPSNGYTLLGANGQALDATTGNWAQPHDEPLDKTTDPTLWESAFPDGNRGIRYEGTNRRFRVVYLQRLANPLAPWDADFNPYRTVDAMHVDLTVFNGTTGATDPELLTAQHSEFYSVQRGKEQHTLNDPGLDNNQRNNIWVPEPEPALTAPAVSPPRDVYPSPAAHFYNDDFAHTLGRLNAWYGNPRPAGGPDPAGRYLGDSLDTVDPNDGPWPWLTWLNRPFVNEMELLLVPNKRSSQLLRAFTIGQEASDPYSPADDVNLSFQHLMPLLGMPPDSGAPPLQRASRLYRLLEYVHVPSRFVGTEIQANPDVMGGIPPESPVGWWPDPTSPMVAAGWTRPLWPPFSFPFRAPYNGISCYREPGRVNLNTIFSSAVWQGLMGGSQNVTNWGKGYGTMDASRRGYVAMAGYLNENFPTQFANPFRSSAGKHLVPPVPDPTKPPGDPAKNDLLGNNIGDEVHATWLRTDPAVAPPLFQHFSADQAEDTARNPYFRYQVLQRLAGSATTRSNVYAVWITVGYFEVSEASNPGWPPAQYQAVFPEGYQLGPELGSDTGEVRRHRAFYLFDRSIPVGFERGRNVNVEDAVLLERFIE